MKFVTSALLIATLFDVLPGGVSAALIHRYSFEDGTANDTIGGINGKLVGPGASIFNGQLILNNPSYSGAESGSFLEFTASPLPLKGSVSIVAWFTVKDADPFTRIFDFGQTDDSDGHQFIYFSPRTADGTARAAITATNIDAKRNVDFHALDDSKPHMVVVVVDGVAKKLRVFADGKEAASAEDIGENTLDKISPRCSWLGKSLFSDNPLLNGSIDEFRVYDHVMDANEVAVAFKNGPNFLPIVSSPPEKRSSE